MFDSRLEVLNNGRVHKRSLTHHGEPLRYVEVLTLWQRDEVFRSFFMSLLSDAPFSAFRWETPPVTNDMVSRPFEFVLLSSPWLACTPDPEAYASHFAAADSGSGVVVFENLGKDATLVVPSPRGPESAYGHLAAFIRHAPESQKHALWRIVGQTMQEQLTDGPLWLSTAGGGVAWIHVRLDSWPKYYGFRPYKKPA